MDTFYFVVFVSLIAGVVQSDETLSNDTVHIFGDADASNSTNASNSTSHSNGTTGMPDTSPTDEVSCDLSSTEGHWMSNMFHGVEVTGDNSLIVNDGATTLACHTAFRNGNIIFKTASNEFSCVHFVKKNDNNVVMEIHATGHEAGHEFPVTSMTDPSTEEVLELCDATKHDVILLRQDLPLLDVTTSCPSKTMGRFHTPSDDTIVETVAKATGTQGILGAVKDLNLFGTGNDATEAQHNATVGPSNATHHCPNNGEICGDVFNDGVICMISAFMPEATISDIGCVGDMGNDIQLAAKIEDKEGLTFFCLKIKDTSPETVHIIQGECTNSMTGLAFVLEIIGQCPHQGSTTTEDDENVSDGGCSQVPNVWLMILFTLAVTIKAGGMINDQ